MGKGHRRDMQAKNPRQERVRFKITSFPQDGLVNRRSKTFQ